jgi:cysteinyl-tRNA synthetase
MRLAMLRTHYRQPIDWTLRALEEAEATLDRWYDAVGDAEPADEIFSPVLDALSDDLNTPAALAELHRLAHPATLDSMKPGAAHLDISLSPRLLKSTANLVGLLQTTRSQHVGKALREAAIDTKEIDRLVAERVAARANKNWTESDRLRDELATLGVAIKDNKDGTTTWEPKR